MNVLPVALITSTVLCRRQRVELKIKLIGGVANGIKVISKQMKKPGANYLLPINEKTYLFFFL